MAVSRVLILAVTLMAAVSLPSRACTRPTATEPELCAVHLPRIVAVYFDENGTVAPAAEGDGFNCSKFRLNADEVRRFFARAESTDQRQAQEFMGWSPCYAAGTLKFADGRLAGWSIHRYATGSLAIVGGERLYVACPECEFPPFR